MDQSQALGGGFFRLQPDRSGGQWGNYLEDHPRTRNWLGSPPFISHLAHLEGEYLYLGDLLNMVINHLLNGRILQVWVRECLQFIYVPGRKTTPYIGDFHSSHRKNRESLQWEYKPLRVWDTLPKNNIAPENRPSQKERTTIFQVQKC